MKRFHKLTAWLLTLAMLMTCIPGFALTTFATGTDTGKAIQLVDSGTAANISGGQASSIYFGTYQQSSLGNTEPTEGAQGVGWMKSDTATKNGQGPYYKIEPIKWRVLSNADGKLFLLSDQTLDTFNYHDKNGSVTWETSTMRSWLNGYAASFNTGGDSGIDYTSDNFLNTAFSAKDQTAIADTTVVNVDNPDYQTEGGNNTTDKVFLLSIAEARNTSYFANDNSRIGINTDYAVGGGETGEVSVDGGVGLGAMWWLRSPGKNNGNAATVSGIDGACFSNGRLVPNSSIDVRPAFNLNLNSVLFTSAANNEGHISFGAPIPDYSDSEWKVTLKDDNDFSTGASVTGTTKFAEGYSATELTINHAALDTFTDAGYTNVTATLTDASGNLIYYGSINDVVLATSSTIIIPAGLAVGDYTLSVYGEDQNDAKCTDYATGTPYTTTITVCDHSGSTHTTGTNNGDGTHSYTCSVCDSTDIENHTLTFFTNESTITEKCIKCEGTVGTLTVNATGKIYDETAVEATVTKTGTLENATVHLTCCCLDGCKDAKEHTASITYGDVTAEDKFTIEKKSIDGASIAEFDALTYDGQPQTPNAAVTIEGLTVTGAWSDVTNVTDKTTFTADGNFTGTIANKETEMAKINPTYTAPTVKTDLVYNGSAQELLNEGTAEGGTMKYYIGGTQATETVTTGTSAGEYTVTCIVAGDENHNHIVVGEYTVTIAKKTIDSAIVLTAPVRNAIPQTEITGTGYTATVTWSPEVTDKFGYNTEYTATVTITPDENHTVTGVAANGYTVEGAKTVTNDENSNVVTVTYEKTGSRPSYGGGGSSNTLTTTTKNEDGSTTKVTENKATGTKTEVTTNTDGSTTTVETKKDGTKTVTTENADGSTTTEEVRKDGTEVKTETTNDGETTAEVKADGKAEVTIPVPDTEKVQMVVVTDENGNNTYITEIETSDNGVAVTTDGNATVSVMSGDKKEFVDVHHVNHWSEKSVDFVYILGLMNGTREHHFSPDVHLTRAMLVTVLYRAEGEPEVANDKSFADVENGSYYEKAVAWAKANGIVNGTSATTFEPNSNITREQIAAIMHRYADFKGHDVQAGENTKILSYDDVHHISEYAIGAMQYAVGSGLIKGKTEATLNPLDNATRAEAAAILERFIKAN